MFLKKFGDLAAGVFFLILSIALFLAASALPPSLMGGLGLRLHAEGSGHHYLHPLLLSNPCRIPHHAKLPAE